MELHLFTYTPEKTKCITYTGHSHISLDVLNFFPCVYTVKNLQSVNTFNMSELYNVFFFCYLLLF